MPVRDIENSISMNLHLWPKSPVPRYHPYANTDWLRHWLIKDNLVGAPEWRPRSGEWQSPIKPRIHHELAMPERRDTMSLDRLMDQRAEQIIAHSRQTGKRVVIMWSGGIDSTAVMVSLMRNQFKDFAVVMNHSSVYENFDFYDKHVKGQEIIPYNTVDITEQFLTDNLLLSGDPGDAIFTPINFLYRSIADNGDQHRPWKQMWREINHSLTSATVGTDSSWASWFLAKVARNIESSGMSDHVVSVAEFWHWVYFNFQYHTACTRQLSYLKHNNDAIDESLTTEFLRYTFFNTHDFQNWSFNNLRRNTMNPHKQEVKNYVKQFHDITFKHKVGTFTPRINSPQAWCHNQRWQVLDVDKHKKELLIQLESYREDKD